jgi:hypothetical protein
MVRPALASFVLVFFIMAMGHDLSVPLALQRVVFVTAGMFITGTFLALAANYRGMSEEESRLARSRARGMTRAYWVNTSPIHVRFVGFGMALFGGGILGYGVLWTNLETAWGGIWYATLGIAAVATLLTATAVLEYTTWKEKRQSRLK